MSEIQIEFEAEGGDPGAAGANGAETSADSLEVILHLTREQFIAQQTNLSALDAKAGFILGSASLLTGVLAVWQRPQPGDYILLTNVFHERAAAIIQWTPIVALVIYLLVVGSSFTAYLPFRFAQAPDPNALNSAFRSRPAEETRKAALDATLVAFNENAGRLRSKAILVRVAFGALLAEALVVAALLGAGYLH